MSEFLLEAKQRQVGQHSQLTKIRENSQVPGVVYGFHKDPQLITVDYNVLLKILTEAGTSNIITLKLAGQEIKVMVREYQQDPVTDKIKHIDFYALTDKRMITTTVPLNFIGTSKAVKEQGGKLTIKQDKVKVKCLPANLPATIEVDLNLLAEIGQTILVSGLEVSDKVTILNNPNNPVISVALPKKIQLTTEEQTEAKDAATEAVESEAAVDDQTAQEKEGEAKNTDQAQTGEK